VSCADTRRSNKTKKQRIHYCPQKGIIPHSPYSPTCLSDAFQNERKTLCVAPFYREHFYELLLKIKNNTTIIINDKQ
jgi:hypothetical protein